MIGSALAGRHQNQLPLENQASPIRPNKQPSGIAAAAVKNHTGDFPPAEDEAFIREWSPKMLPADGSPEAIASTVEANGRLRDYIEGVVEERRGTGYLVRTEQGQLEVPSELQHAMGDAVVVSARPEHIALTTDRNGGGPNLWSGRVGARAFLGEVVDHVVAVGGTEIRVRCNSTISIPPETDVTLVFNQEALTLIPAGD